MSQPRTVSLSIETTTDSETAKAFEVLGRIAGGLTCEGIECRIYSFKPEPEDTP